MRIWKVVSFIVLVVAVGQLIYIFQGLNPSAYTTSGLKPTRHVMLDADYFPLLCDTLLVVVIIGMVAGGARRRSKPNLPEEEYSWWKLMLIRIGAMVFMVILYYLVIRRRIENKEILKVFTSFQNLRMQQAPGPGMVMAQPTAFEQYLVILLSLVIVVIIALIIVSMLKPRVDEEEPPILVAFPEYMLRKREFQFDGAPRDVVINAYGAALDTLSKKGIPVFEHLTPWELQKQIGSLHLRTLTHLFEKARYSTHEISPEDSEEALNQYQLIQEEEIDVPHTFLKDQPP